MEMHDAIAFLLLLAALGAGLMAGTFFAFSSFVMRALGEVPGPEGVRAMQAINRTVLNPAFFTGFFGTLIIGLALAVLGAIGYLDSGAPEAIAGGLVYALGCIGVTIAFNIPLNNRLAAVDADAPEAAILWAHYLRRWTFFNTVRTVACAAACASFILAFAGA